MASVVSAGLVPGAERGTWVEAQEVTSVNQLPSIPIPGRGGDVLFVFPAYSSASAFAWGNLYWNPTDDQSPSTWSFDAVNPSTAIPEGSPYHWNGGLGSAMDNLGYTWEWYPTFDDADAMQVFPSSTILDDYQVIFVHVFDNWQNAGLNAVALTTLSDFMDAGGFVVLIGQDVHYAGLSNVFLDDYFACGTITNDVIGGESLVAATGSTGTFLNGWAGTSNQSNYSTWNSFFPDGLTTNGVITDMTYLFSSYKDASRCIFSTFEFETCDAAEVEEIADLIMIYMMTGALEQTTWSGIKSSF